MDSVYLTKLVSLFIYPLGLFVLLNIFAIFSKWVGRTGLASLLIFVAWVGLLMASTPKVAQHLLHTLERQFPQQTIESYAVHDAILVLGGGLRIPQPPAKVTQLTSGSDRYWYAAQLYHAGKAQMILIAGGNVFAQPGFKGEAYYAAQLLQAWGVPASAIKIETASRNTQQNVANISAWLTNQQVESLLLVTSAYHLPRSLWGFVGSAVKVTPAAADVLVRETTRPSSLDWLPSAGALSLTTIALHEYYGIAFIHLQRVLGQD